MGHPDQFLQVGSDQDNTHPLAGQVFQDGVDFILGAHVDAGGGFIHDQQFQVPFQPFAQDHLLLVATAHKPYRFVRVVGAHIDGTDGVQGHVQFALFVNGRAGAPDDIVVGQGHVAGGGQQRDESLAPAVLRHKAHPCPDALFGAGAESRLPVKGKSPGGNGVDAVDSPHQFGAPGADEPADAQDLPFVQGETHVLEVAQVAQMFHLQQFFPLGLPHGLDGTGTFVHHLADHMLDHLAGVDLVMVQHHFIVAVPQHRQPVGQAVDFLQPVADVDDGYPLLPQLFDDGEQGLRLFAREGGRGFVHDQQFGIAA